MNKSNKLRLAGGAIVALVCAVTIVQAAETVVVGPVESLGPKGSSITILGQSFVVAGKAPALSNSLHEGSGSVLGAYVLAKGEVAANGKLVATSVALLEAAYVPGATLVFLRGTVDSYDASVGVLSVGAVKILISQALASSSLPLAVGESIEVVGTQALAAGPVWATAIESLGSPASGSGDRVSLDAIVGTGLTTDAIVGTGVATQAIVGTGASVQAIVGTGKQAQAIVDTGKQAQAIVGTGASTQAIVGTGVQAQAIVGTGKQAQAIVGTGKQAQAIVGTGASTQAIVGTGVQAQAIVGTGKQAQAIVGTGKQAQAIVGTGASTQAIVGTGVQAQAIVGTGASTQAIVGTGKQSRAIVGTG